jgi:hypothetical protein
MNRYILFIILCFSSLLLSKDIEIKTNDGKLVILHDDGTWEYKIVEEVDISSLDVDCEYWKNEVDDFTGDTKRFTNNIKIGKTKSGNKVQFSYGSVKNSEGNTISLSLKNFGDLGCMSQTSTSTMKLSDGSMVKLEYHGDIDCSDGANFYSVIYSDTPGLEEYVMDEDDWNKFMTLEVEMIRINGSEYYTDTTLDEDKRTHFISYINCVN